MHYCQRDYVKCSFLCIRLTNSMLEDVIYYGGINKDCKYILVPAINATPWFTKIYFHVKYEIKQYYLVNHKVLYARYNSYSSVSFDSSMMDDAILFFLASFFSIFFLCLFLCSGSQILPSLRISDSQILRIWDFRFPESQICRISGS